MDRVNHVIQHWHSKARPDTDPESVVHDDVCVGQFPVDSARGASERGLAKEISAEKKPCSNLLLV